MNLGATTVASHCRRHRRCWSYPLRCYLTHRMKDTARMNTNMRSDNRHIGYRTPDTLLPHSQCDDPLLVPCI